MTDEQLRRVHHERFGSAPALARAPGRVNLIGEHTDYNDGFVLPVAIELSTRVAFSRAAGSALVVRSTAFPDEEVALPLRRDGGRRGHWSDYVAGALRLFETEGFAVPPAALTIDGDVPLGSGLGSSASLSVAVCGALLSLVGATMPGEAVALLGQRVENEYVGARCGVMDPYVSCLGRPGQALLLDCRSHERSYVPVPASLDIVVIDSGVRHSIAGGEYNRRRAECEAAVSALRRGDPRVRALRDVTPAGVEEARTRLGDVGLRRARHVATENARVRAFAGALRAGDFSGIGRLMAASHESLRRDFEVSCAELDLLVRIAGRRPEAVGTRMTGGGFGGCTVNLVHAGCGPAFARAVAAGYARATGSPPATWITRPAAGARVD